MNVRELTDMIDGLDPEGEVLIYNADAEGYCPVTGMAYGGEENEIMLHSDDIS